MKVRDWISVGEFATRRGLKKPTVYKQIEQNRFPHPYDQTDTGTILIFYPQKREAKSQATSGKATCDLAGTK